MFKFIEFLRKRPSDKMIRIIRIVLWLIIVWLLSLEFNDFKVILPQNLAQYEIYFKYSLFALWIVPILLWIFDPCILKRKHMKIVQILLWIVLITVWNLIYFEEPKVEVAKEWSIDINTLTSVQKKEPINIWFYIALLWIFPIIAWISGKCISKKCYKHWEVITKIRV